jgi:hypothetical protein
MEHNVAERGSSFFTIGGESLVDQASSIHRFNVVLTESLGPVWPNRDEATHQNARNESERYHRFAVVVDEQTHLEKRPVFQHFRVCRSFHVLSEKLGVFEQALWGQPAARFA